MAKARDYGREYARRIQRGRARGLSRAQARGHPRAHEPFATGTRSGSRDPRLEEGLKFVREGDSAAGAADRIDVRPEKLRDYIHRSGVRVTRKGRQLSIGTDPRVREMSVYSRGKRVSLRLSFEESRHAGGYMSAVGQALANNDPSFLGPYEDDAVIDLDGTAHPLETRMNVLYRLDASSEERPDQIYKIVA